MTSCENRELFEEIRYSGGANKRGKPGAGKRGFFFYCGGRSFSQSKITVKAKLKYPPPKKKNKKKTRELLPYTLKIKGRGFFAPLNFDQKLGIEFYQVLVLVNLLSLDF